jgi:hypothetical protein
VVTGSVIGGNAMTVSTLTANIMTTSTLTTTGNLIVNGNVQSGAADSTYFNASGNQRTGGLFLTGDITAAQWQLALTGGYKLGFLVNNTGTTGPSSNYTQVISFGNTGNVGINYNVDSPNYKLVIEQGFGNNSNGLFISNTNYGSMQGFGLSMVNNGSSNFFSYATIQGYSSGVAAEVPLCLQPTSGNVGIGTNNPATLLSIYGINNMFSLVNSNTGNTTYMSFVANGANRGFIGLDNSAGVGLFGSGIAYGFDIGTPNNAPISFCTNNAIRMTIAGNGNVGIGTNSPSSTLTVNGDISATSKLEVSSADSYQTVGLQIGTRSGTAGSWQFSVAGSNGPQTQGALYIYSDRAGVATLVIQPTTGNLFIAGSLSKGSGTFDIAHPLYPNTNRRLVHSFIEGPRCDLIYRGIIVLINGSASVYIDKQCTYAPENAMDDGTFEALCANPQYFLQNMSGFNRVIGSIYRGILTITCENNTATDMISWMVVAERKDPFVKNWDRTDSNGYLNTQYMK